MTIFFLILLGIIPSFAWLVFFTQEDCHPEPRKLIFYTFISGILVTLLALQVQTIVNAWLVGAGVGSYTPLSLIILTAIEELAKFFAAFWIIRGRREFDEPVDAMIYIIVAALGFAAVENIALVFQSYGNGKFTAAAIEIITLRFVGATLLHSLSSAVVGYYWGRTKVRGIHPAFVILWGLVIATVLHASFNYLIINLNALIWPVVFLVFIAMFIFEDFEILKKYQ